MALKPIYGYSGDHPVLDYDGTLPVCMESPNPHPMWSFVPLPPDDGYNTFNSYFTVSEGLVQMHEEQELYEHAYVFYGTCQVYMVYTGKPKLKLTSCGSNIGTPWMKVKVLVEGVVMGTHIFTTENWPESKVFDVPYYRYSLWVYMQEWDSLQGLAWVGLQIEFED